MTLGHSVPGADQTPAVFRARNSEHWGPRAASGRAAVGLGSFPAPLGAQPGRPGTRGAARPGPPGLSKPVWRRFSRAVLALGGHAWGQRDGVMRGSRPPRPGFIPSPSWSRRVPRSHAPPHAATQTVGLVPPDC